MDRTLNDTIKRICPKENAPVKRIILIIITIPGNASIRTRLVLIWNKYPLSFGDIK